MTMKLEDIGFRDLGTLDASALEKTLEADTTLKLLASTDAFVAADIIKHNRISAIAVVDEQENLQCLVFPDWIRKQVTVVRNENPQSFEEALLLIKQDGDAQGGPDETRTYHHEWLNHENPVLAWCEQGEHYIDTMPCKYHG